MALPSEGIATVVLNLPNAVAVRYRFYVVVPPKHKIISLLFRSYNSAAVRNRHVTLRYVRCLT